MSCSCECGTRELWVGNTMSIKVALFDAITRLPINDAVVTYTLQTATGSVVDELAGVGMAFSEGSEGEYRGIVPADATLTVNHQYQMTVVAVSPGVGTARFHLSLRARHRTGCG